MQMSGIKGRMLLLIVMIGIILLIFSLSKYGLFNFLLMNNFSIKMTCYEKQTLFIGNTSNFSMNSTGKVLERHSLELGESLNSKNDNIRSPNNRYLLILKPYGDLQLSRLSLDIATGELIFNRLWWTSTGDHFPNSNYEVQLNSKGILELTNYNPDRNWPKEGVVVWKSEMDNRCHRGITYPIINPKLILDDQGELYINSTHGILCKIFSDVWSPLTKPHGNLAVVITGFFRTNEIACLSHRQFLENWNGQVHVYIGTYLQEVFFRNKSQMINEESIRNHFKSCYGRFYKDSIIRDVNQVAENFILPSKDSNLTLFPSYDHHNRLRSQLKNIYETSQLLRSNMIHEGLSYSYILKFRPDTNFLSPLINISNVINDNNRLLLIHPRNEHYFYCNTHHGKAYVGPSDQTAFGRTSLMFPYLDMYLDFDDLVKVSYGTKLPFGRDYRAMYLAKALYEPIGIAIECYIPYYLVLKGIEYEAVWNWNSGVLRGDGSTSKQCGKTFNC